MHPLCWEHFYRMRPQDLLPRRDAAARDLIRERREWRRFQHLAVLLEVVPRTPAARIWRNWNAQRRLLIVGIGMPNIVDPPTAAARAAHDYLSVEIQ